MLTCRRSRCSLSLMKKHPWLLNLNSCWNKKWMTFNGFKKSSNCRNECCWKHLKNLHKEVEVHHIQLLNSLQLHKACRNKLKPNVQNNKAGQMKANIFYLFKKKKKKIRKKPGCGTETSWHCHLCYLMTTTTTTTICVVAQTVSLPKKKEKKSLLLSQNHWIHLMLSCKSFSQITNGDHLKTDHM